MAKVVGVIWKTARYRDLMRDELFARIPEGLRENSKKQVNKIIIGNDEIQFVKGDMQHLVGSRFDSMIIEDAVFDDDTSIWIMRELKREGEIKNNGTGVQDDIQQGE